jgi:hypothetical protein
MGQIGVEATTVNPPDNGAVPEPQDRAEFIAYLENYVPIKIARALKRKLFRQNPYWEIPELRGIPFILAVQDFHGPGSMRMIVSATTEYVFGVRHSLKDGQTQVERLVEHRFDGMRETSGFFDLPGAENVSAVLVNPQGTVTKFNRMGYIAGFGSRRVLMTRSGVRRGELDGDGLPAKNFRQNVHDPGYQESWVEGMVVLHNPKARLSLDPMLVPGAAHEFLQPDGKIMSLIPAFHPLFSQTSVVLSE